MPFVMLMGKPPTWVTWVCWPLVIIAGGVAGLVWSEAAA
jgi:hypothetical protein